MLELSSFLKGKHPGPHITNLKPSLFGDSKRPGIDGGKSIMGGVKLGSLWWHPQVSTIKLET